MSKYTVVKIQDGKPTAKGKPTKVLVYSDGNTEESVLIFNGKLLDGLSSGDLVDINFTFNGKYKNVESIELISKGAPPATSGGKQFFSEDPKKQESISRAVALDKAVVLVTALASKTTTTSKALSDVLDTAEIFFKFLSGQETVLPDEQPVE